MLFRFVPDLERFAMNLACCPFNKTMEHFDENENSDDNDDDENDDDGDRSRVRVVLENEFVMPDLLHDVQVIPPEFNDLSMVNDGNDDNDDNDGNDDNDDNDGNDDNDSNDGNDNQ